MPIRIHQLAKELGLESKQLIEFLSGRGVSVQGPLSTIKEDEAELVRIFLEPDGESVNQPSEAPDTLVPESATQADEVSETLNFENDDPEILAGDTAHNLLEETTNAFAEVINDNVPEDLNVFSDDQFPRINEAVMSWKAGDVYSAWKVIGEVCAAPWVNEVLEALDLREPLVQQRTPEEEARWQDERARKIRTDIEEELSRESSVEGDPPPLKESVNTLKRFLKSVNENDAAIAWLRDSARHTVERLSEASEAPLKVAILGEFSSGKSRLINALLGEKILSIGLVPVTRSVTRIVYGEEIRVTVKHLDGSAVDVAPDQLKAYTDERKKEDGSSEVEEVILEFPAPLLKQVEIWDTPGFNSNNQLHDQVAAQLMLEADAVLWVIAAHQVGSRSETKLLETVKRAQGKVVGVLNQIDRLESTEAIEQQKSEAWNHYGEMIKEVVPTSGKWLEEKREEANRGLLMAEIEKIGSWSQEQRNRKEARRVGIVAKQCDLLLLAKQREEAAVSEKQYKLKIELDKQCAVALELWKEAMAHHNRINPHKKTASDKWWKTDNAHRSNLHKAYQFLVNDSFSNKEKKYLYECLGVLEEAHWHLSGHDPVPWKKDFLVSWNKARLNKKEDLSILQGNELVFRSDLELLRRLAKESNEGKIIRFHGDARKNNKVDEIKGFIQAFEVIEEKDSIFKCVDVLVNEVIKSGKFIQTIKMAESLDSIEAVQNYIQKSQRFLSAVVEFVIGFKNAEKKYQIHFEKIKSDFVFLTKSEPLLSGKKVKHSKIDGSFTSNNPEKMMSDRIAKLLSVEKQAGSPCSGSGSGSNNYHSKRLDSLLEKKIRDTWNGLSEGDLQAGLLFQDEFKNNGHLSLSLRKELGKVSGVRRLVSKYQDEEEDFYDRFFNVDKLISNLVLVLCLIPLFWLFPLVKYFEWSADSKKRKANKKIAEKASSVINRGSGNNREIVLGETVVISFKPFAEALGYNDKGIKNKILLGGKVQSSCQARVEELRRLRDKYRQDIELLKSAKNCFAEECMKLRGQLLRFR